MANGEKMCECNSGIDGDVETDVVFFLSVYIMGFDEQTNILFYKILVLMRSVVLFNQHKINLH